VGHWEAEYDGRYRLAIIYFDKYDDHSTQNNYIYFMSTVVIESQQAKTIRVLLIEDNPLDARLVTSFLRSFVQTAPCRSVSRLSAALEEMRHAHFDVVLLDLELEDSSGFDTFLAVREAADDAAILVLSGSENEELAIRTVREGAQDYLVKGSFDQKLLSRAIRYALERKASEEALRRSEATVRAIFENSVDGIVIWNDAGECLQANTAAAELICAPREELLGQRMCKLSGESMEDEWTKVRRCESARGLIWIRRRDGVRRRVDYCFKGNIQPGKHLGVLRDVTDQQNLEEQLRQSQKMEAVGRLAGGVAHDFNNILGVISGYAELMQINSTDPGQLRKAEQIISACEKAAALTRQLLVFGRKQVISPRLIDIAEVVAGIRSMLSTLMSAETEIVVEVKEPLSMVNADQSQLEQVILNLATNAREAMPDGGKLTIVMDEVENNAAGLMPLGKYVRLMVSDTGCGIPAEHLSRIFEPFFSTKTSGTGLGLSTVYGIIKQSGGFVTVNSSPEVGSTFSIYLPAVAASKANAQKPPEKVALSYRGSGTILLVDDEDSLREAAREYLELSGYKVLTARDGQEAVEVTLACHDKIDLLVSDVTMPRFNGLRLVEHVRESMPDTKILVISGYANDEEMRMVDPESFLQKPFSLNTLGLKVRGLLHHDG
jgi:two-component system cell cycle sensor histidine kinase/response regulator CckA